MTGLAIIISLLFAIVFPILLTNKAFSVKSPSVSIGGTSNNSLIEEYFNIYGFYLFLFIGLVVVTTILVAVSKKKTVKLVSYGLCIISFSYFLNVFVKMVKAIWDNDNCSMSASSIILLILFIIILNCNTITLIATSKKKLEEGQTQTETI